jgi:predicted ATPase
MPDTGAIPDDPAATAVIRTPDQRLRVFISSTLKELAAEREAAAQAITQLRLIPVLFETGARPHPPRNLYRAYLGQSHIFIGIYWQSYGWVAPDMNISGLEDEYRLARALPKLIYIKTPAPDIQPELKKMLQQLKSDDAVSYKYFGDAAELGELIANDLALFLTEQFEQARQQPRTVSRPEPEQVNGRSHLPHPPTSIIGREAAITAVRELLSQPQVRLVTLTGPGGVGKTRLGLAVATGLDDHFSDGIHWVDLAALDRPDLVIPAIAQVLDVREREGHPLRDSLLDFLRRRRLLLLLDNFEQVAAAAPVLADLLTAAPGLKLLVTSRVSLQLRGEHTFPVPPLPVPDPGLAADEPLPQTAAVRLFVERAQAVRPDFMLTPENGRDVAAIVCRLDGLPLAIELAAARLKLLPPHLLRERLNERLKLLSGGPQDLPLRQQTLHNVMQWSYDLLSPPEQRLFARLGIFVGGFTLDAATAICRLDDDPDVFEGVAALLDNSLLQTGAVVGGQPRFTMLETVREYALARLHERGASERIHRQHATFFTDLATAARSRLFSGESEQWLDYLHAEVGNFRVVWQWSQASDQRQSFGWQLIPNLAWFAYRRGYLHEARRWCEVAIAQMVGLADDPLRASVLIHAGLVAMWQSDLTAAARLMDEGLAMMRRLEDRAGLLDAFFPRSVLAANQGDVARAHELIAEALPRYEADGLTWFVAMLHLHRGNVHLSQGKVSAAEADTRLAHELGQQVGDPWVIASAVNNFGELARRRGDYDAAEPFYRESQALFRQINSAPDVARAQHSLAWLLLSRDDRAAARALFTQALALHQQLGIKRGVVECLAGLAAVVATAEGDASAEKAVTLFAAVRAQFEQLGTPPWSADDADLQRYLATARARLSQATFAAAWDRGQKLSLSQALAEAESDG